MSNTPISGLPSVTPPVTSSALVPVVQGGVTTSTQVSQLITGLPQVTGSADGKMIAADKSKLDSATDANTASAIVKRDGSGNFAGNVITAAQVTVTGAPSASTDATNKAYVDAVAIGLTIKAAVKVATTGSNYTLAGGTPSTLDGQSLSLNDRVLVKDQSSSIQNGIYTVTTVGSGSNGTWTRATDADTGAELPTNSYVFVQSGTAYGSTSWVMNTPGAITIGVSAIVWILFSQITSIPASNITGQIIGSQIANLALTTAKFAAGLTPVEIVAAMPTTSNFQGRMVFLTTVDGSFAANKLYRWTDTSTTGNTFWTSIVPAVDITGQITTTQISDSGITTPKIASNAITTAKLNAGCITSNELASNSVIAGKIQAGAISATEIAVGTIDKTRIANGTITTTQIAANTIIAGNLNISTLSSITANIGTITAGTITSSSTIDVGTSYNRTLISSSGIDVGSGALQINSYGGGNGSQLWVNGGVRGVRIYAQNAAIAAIQVINAVGSPVITANDTGALASTTFTTTGAATIGGTLSVTGALIPGTAGITSFGTIGIVGQGLNSSGYIKVTGASGTIPSGQGLELLYDSGTTTAKVNSYNRGSSSYENLALQALKITFGDTTSQRVEFIAGADGGSPSDGTSPDSWIACKRNGVSGFLAFYV